MTLNFLKIKHYIFSRRTKIKATLFINKEFVDNLDN